MTGGGFSKYLGHLQGDEGPGCPHDQGGTNKSDLAMDLRIGSKSGDGGVGPRKFIYIRSIGCVKIYRHVVCPA